MTPDELEREVLRLNQRYLVEVVERFALCPWAYRTRVEGHLVQRVFQQKSPDDLAPSLACISSLSTRSEVEIALFIYPLLELERLPFEHFVRRLRALDDDRYEVGEVPFAMAAFHPDAEPHLDHPERLIPFLRRSPYPTIQLVRRSALERVRGSADEGTAYFDLQLLGSPAVRTPEPMPLRERIARANLATVQELGVAALERVFADLALDRERTHQRLGLAPAKRA